jgi:hypothetical protein
MESPNAFDRKQSYLWARVLKLFSMGKVQNQRQEFVVLDLRERIILFGFVGTIYLDIKYVREIENGIANSEN